MLTIHRSKRIVVCISLVLVVLLATSCAPAATPTPAPLPAATPTTAPLPTTETTTPPTTTIPPTTETITPPTPPSAEELAKQGFALPEIPRITCEELKQMMDRGDDFVLVDTRSAEWGYNLGHLPGAINIQNELVPPALPEDMEEAPIELMKLMMLPKDKLIIFYCD